MNEQDFSDFVKNRYEDQLQWYDQKSITCKRNHDVLQTIIIFCSSLTPVLILILEPDWKILAVFTSMIVAISTGLIATFKIREKWINYRITAESMRKEYSHYKTDTEKYSVAQDKQKLFVESIEFLLAGEVTNWQNIQKKK